jgi:hypothetical protein
MGATGLAAAGLAAAGGFFSSANFQFMTGRSEMGATVASGEWRGTSGGWVGLGSFVQKRGHGPLVSGQLGSFVQFCGAGSMGPTLGFVRAVLSCVRVRVPGCSSFHDVFHSDPSLARGVKNRAPPCTRKPLAVLRIGDFLIL